MTQDELAKASGINRISISRIENGRDVRPPTARKLAEALGCRPSDLMGSN